MRDREETKLNHDNALDRQNIGWPTIQSHVSSIVLLRPMLGASLQPFRTLFLREARCLIVVTECPTRPQVRTSLLYITGFAAVGAYICNTAPTGGGFLKLNAGCSTLSIIFGQPRILRYRSTQAGRIPMVAIGIA